MKYNELTITANKSRKRVGRGIAAGQGKTAGRGTKGQKSRAGSSKKPGFEGGQNPLSKRFPKLRGFTSHRKEVENVYTGQLDSFGALVDNVTLADAGLISNCFVKVKLVVKGEVTKKHTVSLQGASVGAIELIQKVGGEFKKIEQVSRPATDKDAKNKTKIKK